MTCTFLKRGLEGVGGFNDELNLKLQSYGQLIASIMASQRCENLSPVTKNTKPTQVINVIFHRLSNLCFFKLFDYP